MQSIIVIFHTPSNAGYAMSPLERMFYNVGCELCGGPDNVHFGFSDLDAGLPKSLPDDFKNVIAVSPKPSQRETLKKAAEYIKRNNITIALCFDLQPSGVLCKALRSAGVKTLVSYWGSTISPLNSGLKLFLKRMEVALSPNRPNLFIFESESMREYAVSGRGIPTRETCVIPTGVNTEKFIPHPGGKQYLQDQFGIPTDRFVVFYSGHMEERKGVHVIMRSAIELIDKRNLDKIHFLICGNRPGEEQPFLEMLKNSKASTNVTFGGYRTDVDELINGSDIGMIASTGWDSFPMSSLEMASCGLPIVVSALQGLKETLVHGKTGLSFTPGNHIEASDYIQQLYSDRELRSEMSQAARERIVKLYSLEHQKRNLISHISRLL